MDATHHAPLVRCTSLARALTACALLLSACGSDNAPPNLVFVEDQLVRVGERMQVTLLATDDDGDSVSFQVAGLPAAAELAPIGSRSALLIWSPLVTDVVAGGRVYELEVIATDDGGGEARQTFSITAMPSDGPPVIELPPGMTLDLSVSPHLTLLVEVRDHDSTEVDIALAEGPEGTQLLTAGPKSALLHWKPQGTQLLSLVHRFTILATDEANPPVSQTMMVVLLGASDGAGCPGTAPNLVHEPLEDQNVDGPLTLSADVQDQESQITGVALHWTLGDPDTGVYQTMALLPSESNPSRFEGTLAVGDLSPVGSLLHYALEATDNDDPTSEACDHHVSSPKEGSHRVGLYPAGSPATLCVDDEREPDDDSIQASQVGPGLYTGRLCGADVDLFTSWIEGGSTFTARLLHESDHGTLSLELLGPGGEVLDEATVNQGHLVVHHQAVSSGAFTVRVSADAPTTRVSYEVELSHVQGVCEPDSLEPNDTIAEAPLLHPGLVEGLEICPGDADWFRVSLSEASLVQITVRSEPGFGDVDLVLAEASTGSIVATSLTYDPTEYVAWTSSGAAELWVWVYGYLGGVNAYEIEVLVTPLAGLCFDDLLGTHMTKNQALVLFGNAPYTGLVACPGTPDWYAVDVNGGETLEVTVTPDEGAGPLSLTVYEEGSDQPVAVDSASGETLTATWSLPWAGRIHMVVEGESKGGYAFSYSLIDPVGPCGDDRLEPNDSDATAATVDAGVLTWLRLCPDDPVDTFAVDLQPFDHLRTTTHHLPMAGYTDVEIVDPSGQVIDSTLDYFDGVNLETVVTTGGIHHVRVLPYDVQETLGYDLAIWVD